jgi:hypothetical protein
MLAITPLIVRLRKPIEYRDDYFYLDYTVLVFLFLFCFILLIINLVFRVWVFNTNFNNILVISWRSVLLVEET